MTSNPKGVNDRAVGGPATLAAVMVLLVGALFGGMWWATQGPLPAARSAPSPAPSNAPSTTGMTPAQLLAVGDGRDKDDAEMAAAYARLDAACPENGEFVADIATNLGALVRKESGQDYPVVYLMNRLSDVQESSGGAASCVETGAAYALVLGHSR